MNRFLLMIIILTSILSTSQIVYAAGMQDQLDDLFGEMQNYTAPGAYDSQRRSAYFGGRFTYKTAVFNENLVSMLVPSAKGGCGGIDVFGGSFSFINSDQLVQLFRQVASNAQGYAFQLAMDNMCPNCMEWMNELQTKVQALNGESSNSCQLAQGLVNDAANMAGIFKKHQTSASLKASAEGLGDDFLQLTKHIGNVDTAVQQIFDNDPDIYNEDLTGNVVYMALKRQSAENWFTGGDEELLETIMSMTGSVVVGELEVGSDGAGQTPKTWVLPGLSADKFSMLDLIEGKNGVAIYDCSVDGDTPNCRITPNNTQNINISGLKAMILDAFTGATGIITRIRNRDFGAALSEEQQNILAAMPESIGSKVHLLAPISPEAAEQMVTTAIDTISLEFIYRLVSKSFDAADIAMANDENTFSSLANIEIEKSKALLEAEYNTLTLRFGSIRKIETHYNELMKNITKPAYISDSQQSNIKGGN